MNFSRAHSRSAAMSTIDHSQVKWINNKIKLYASLNPPSSQLDTLKIMRNKGSSYSKKNFQLQPLPGPRLGTGNKIMRQEKIKYAKMK